MWIEASEAIYSRHDCSNERETESWRGERRKEVCVMNREKDFRKIQNYLFKELKLHFEQFKVSLALCGSKRQKPSIAVMIAVMRGRLRVGEEREEKGF